MKLETIKRYWEEVCGLTADLRTDQHFSTSELITYLNEHLLSSYEQITKTKVNYLRAQGIVNPEGFDAEKIRTNWRYTTDDVRRILVVELLKTREDLSVQEAKGWLHSFEEAQRSGVLIRQEHYETISEIPTAPTPVSLAYALLRNRTLGTLITALGQRDAKMTPPECLIAIRVVNHIATCPRLHKLSSWEEAHWLLETGAWHLAASDSYLKLYFYPDLGELQTNRPSLAQMLPLYRWYVVTFQDTIDQLYEVVLGLPEQDLQQQSIAAIDKTLAQQIENGSPFDLSNFPGLATLLRSAFVNQPKIEEGTSLSVLAEIIATASDAWDYCAILVPERSEDGKEKWLHVQGYSLDFPAYLKDKRVEVGQLLSGWCYRYGQSVVVDSTISNDPRIVFYEEERPIAAAAVPAFTEERQVVGVIYVAKRRSREKEQSFFSKEEKASLQAFGYVCGDMIARDQIEIETVRSMTRLCTLPLITSFSKLEDLLRRVIDEVQKIVSPENAALSWIYLLILNIQTPSQDPITQWLRQQAIEVTGNFLAYRLWDPPYRNPLPIGIYKVDSDQYVFAILKVIDLSEERYKQGITHLQQHMDQMYIGRLRPGFYPSAITFRYESLRQQLKDRGQDSLMDDLVEQTWGALIAGPYIKRGHEALRKPDLDLAVSEFEVALRVLHYAPNSWYVYKHLAEARMLQGTEQAIEEAIEMCRKALKLNRDYASAHCLLADCLSYRDKFGEALIEYERALALNGTRIDFLTRYGLALAGMTTSEYRKARRQLEQWKPELAQQRRYLDEPWLEAIDKFDRVQKLSAMNNETPKEQQERLANYRYYRGYAYLQAHLIDKAVEDFAVGRKLAPDNLQLAQAYSYALSLRRSKKSENKSTEISHSEIKELED